MASKFVLLALVVLMLALCVTMITCDDDNGTVDKVTGYIKDSGKKLGDFAEDTLEKTKKAAKEAADSISDTVQKGYENIKKNTQSSDSPWDKIKGIFSKRR